MTLIDDILSITEIDKYYTSESLADMLDGNQRYILGTLRKMRKLHLIKHSGAQGADYWRRIRLWRRVRITARADYNMRKKSNKWDMDIEASAEGWIPENMTLEDAKDQIYDRFKAAVVEGISDTLGIDLPKGAFTFDAIGLEDMDELGADPNAVWEVNTDIIKPSGKSYSAKTEFDNHAP